MQNILEEAHYFYFYCPPTKLRQGRVFGRVCLSVCSQGDPHVTIPHDAFDLTIEGHPFRHGTSL